ncbi:hypothetical protein ACOMHN_004865 [Nucella lapillus]
MEILTNQDFRRSLKEDGVTVANNLTKKQASIVAEARKEGNVAFFKKGRLTVEPRRPDPHSYAEVVAARNHLTIASVSAIVSVSASDRDRMTIDVTDTVSKQQADSATAGRKHE